MQLRTWSEVVGELSSIERRQRGIELTIGSKTLVVNDISLSEVNRLEGRKVSVLRTESGHRIQLID